TELPDELLVYDLERHKAHCLNPTAALVFKHCDGRTSVKQIARTLGSELEFAADERLVWLSLERLGKANLLEARPAPAPLPTRATPPIPPCAPATAPASPRASAQAADGLVPDQAHSGPMIGNCAEKPGVLAVERTHGHAREGISGEADPLGRWRVLSDSGRPGHFSRSSRRLMSQSSMDASTHSSTSSCSRW
ncbi:MAG: PqqD family protein, partial [Deltaproteobacteria bacterium]|nr:PqqD family protein [Deltaproteobacteria bacterium]